MLEKNSNIDTKKLPQCDVLSFSLRQLKAVLKVSEFQNVTRAAHSLSRSQTTITKSVIEVERLLERTLFERSSTGLTANLYGATFSKRVASIERILERAYKHYERTHARPRPMHLIPLFTMDLGVRRISTLIALNESGDIKQTAETADLTPSAIYKFLRELESQLDMPVFDKHPNGRLIASEYGLNLIEQLKLVFSELRHALEDLANLDGLIVGRATIGTLPSARPVVIPNAISKLVSRHPNISIATREAPFERLTKMLSSGDVDMIVSGTRPLAGLDKYDILYLCKDHLCIVAGTKHPLANKPNVSIEDLRACQWVLPPSSTPAGRLFEGIFQELQLGSNVISVESNSTVILRSLVLDSGFIAMASSHQTLAEQKNGTIVELNFEIPDNSWPIGVILRKDTEPSPVAREYLKELSLVKSDTT